MANSDAARGVRHVRCPKCHGVLQEPADVPVYQCGGCGATLRAKTRSRDTQDVASSASPSRSVLPPPPSRRLLGSSGDVPTPPDARSTGTTSRGNASGDLVSARGHGSGGGASSSSTPDATSRRRQEPNPREASDLVVSVARKDRSGDGASAGSTADVATSSGRRQQGTPADTVSASKRESEPATPEKKKERDQSTNRRGAPDSSESRRQGDTGVAERNAVSPGVGANFNLGGGVKGARTSGLQVDSDSEKRRKSQAERPELVPDAAAARKKHSGEAAAVQSRDAAESKLQAEDLAPLRQKILKTVDELKGDLSELFSKSPDLNPTTRPRPPPRLPLPKQQQGRASRGAAASALPASARAAAIVNQNHHIGTGAAKPAARSWRGLPSRRYRRCRADPPCCGSNAQPIRYGCCCRHHHGKPECSSCRGHCGRPTRAYQDPSSAPKKAEPKRRAPPPRHHCRPVLKGAPFIICSSCFHLVQVPPDFAVVSTTSRLRKLRCGACSAVLSYSYRDPARKTKLHQNSISVGDRFSADGSFDPFAPFVDDFGPSSYSTTEDEKQPLHVSRNTSFDTVDGANKQQGVGRLHRLMGYGSASELLRHSPDLYESFDDRTTPDYDRKGKGVCVDDHEDDDDDSDDEGSGVLKRSAARGAVWLMHGIPPGQWGAIRIKS